MASPSPMTDFLKKEEKIRFVYGVFRDGRCVVVVGNGRELRAEGSGPTIEDAMGSALNAAFAAQGAGK